MELSTPVIIAIALLVLVLLIVLIVVGVRASQKRRAQQQEADRQRAAQLREEAAQNEQVVQERDLKARENEIEADRARLDAERKAKEAEREQIAAERRHAEASKQRSAVDQERGAVQDQLAEADRLDPDAAHGSRTGQGQHVDEHEGSSPSHGRRAARSADDRPVAEPDGRTPGSAPVASAGAGSAAALPVHDDEPLRHAEADGTPVDRGQQDRPVDPLQDRPAQQDTLSEQDPLLRQQELAREDGELPPETRDIGRHRDGPEHRG